MPSVFICTKCDTEIEAFLSGTITFKLEIRQTSESAKGLFEIFFHKDEKPHMKADCLVFKCPFCLTEVKPSFTLKETSDYHKKLAGHKNLLVKTLIDSFAVYHGDKIQIPIQQIKKWDMFKQASMEKHKAKLIRRDELNHANTNS